MLESKIIEYCAPTLAGLKTGSLFCGSFRDFDEMREELRRLNGIFREKGLRALPFENRRGVTLVFVYRTALLARDLKSPKAREILTELGYSPEKPAKCLSLLSEKIGSSREFPHEIGLFLGYPPEDVRGFIEKRQCVFSGAWKVYANASSAKRRFSQYKKCSAEYRRLYAAGRSLERLTLR